MNRPDTDNPDTQQVENPPLSEDELRKSSFALISQFRFILEHTQAFGNAAAHYYFGEDDNGYPLTPNDARTVEFWTGDFAYTIEYTFTKDSHEFRIRRTIFQGASVKKAESITLQSSRFVYSPATPPHITYEGQALDDYEKPTEQECDINLL